MPILRTALSAVLLATSSSAWCEQASPLPSDEDGKAAQLLSAGAQLAQSKRPIEAIPYFDRVASSYETRFKDDGTQFFSSRTQAETLMYQFEAANANKGNAIVVSANWAYAYYLKAYALLDLGRIAEAKSLLERALALAPRNSQFLSELGNVYQREKNWQSALQTFRQAEAAAKEFSPPGLQNAELSRAWRGMGYVLVQLDRLDDAEEMYRRCIELDKGDARAMNALRYVQNLKTKARAR